MKKGYYLVTLIFLLAACQKGIEPFDDSNSGGNTNAIEGTWNFISLHAQTQTTSEYTQDDTDYKTITLSNYTTKDSTGTITFDSSSFNSLGVGYNVSSTFTDYNYQNNILVDSAKMPFTFSVDSSNGTGTYQLIGSDSIYFPQGSFVSYNGTSSQATPSGGKININGNLLTITQSLSKDTTENAGGIPLHVIESGTFIIQLQKK